MTPLSFASSPITVSLMVALLCKSIMLLGPVDFAPVPLLYAVRVISATSIYPPFSVNRALFLPFTVPPVIVILDCSPSAWSPSFLDVTVTLSFKVMVLHCLACTSPPKELTDIITCASEDAATDKSASLTVTFFKVIMPFLAEIPLLIEVLSLPLDNFTFSNIVVPLSSVSDITP